MNVEDLKKILDGMDQKAEIVTMGINGMRYIEGITVVDCFEHFEGGHYIMLSAPDLVALHRSIYNKVHTILLNIPEEDQITL